MDLSKFSDEELRAIVAAARAKPAEKPKGTIDNSWAADEMPWWQQAMAGVGKAMVDTVRGAGQLLPGNVVSRKDVDEANARDKALMDTGWGFAGNVAGNLLPAALVPAASIPRAVAAGMGMGFIQPVGEKDSRAMNTMVGGGAAAVIPAGIGAYRLGKGMLEPVVAPRRTATRIIEQFADDPAALALAARSAGTAGGVPGVQPTLAELAQQPGISTLQRSMANQPGPLQSAFTERNLSNNAARMQYLDDLAGRDGRLDFQKAARSTIAEEQYAKAFAEMPDTTPWIKGEVTKLMQRPAFVDALKDGQRLAMNLGVKVSPKNPENSTEILHYTKLALDDKIAALAAKEGTGNDVRALTGIRDKLVSLIESKDFSPSYREARDTFKQMSGPINEMEFAAKLRERINPALSDVTGNTPGALYANAAAQEVRRGADDLARMSPEFQGKVGTLMSDLQRKAAAESLGKPTGSPTAQYLTTQNLMRQVAGPMGMSEGAADKAASMLMSTPWVGSALQLGTKGAEHRVQQELAAMLMNPSSYDAALKVINQNPALAKLPAIKAALDKIKAGSDFLLPYMPATSAVAATGMFAPNRRQ